MVYEIQPSGTFVASHHDGFVRTVNNEAWLYGVMPSQPPVYDAARWVEREQAAGPMFTLLNRLGDLTPSMPMLTRRTRKGFYRQIHILAISTPREYRASSKLPERMRMRLEHNNATKPTHDRFTLFGVRLAMNSDKADGGKQSALAGVANTLLTNGMDNLSGLNEDENFDDDRQIIAGIFQEAGLQTPTEAQMLRAISWWVTDSDPQPTPIMIEPQHAHVFPGWKEAGQGYMFKHNPERLVDCRDWSYRIKRSYPITFCTLGATDFMGAKEEETSESAWAANLLASTNALGAGALALSIRGLVEPGQYSREQIDKDKEAVLAKVEKQMEQGRNTHRRLAGELNAVNDLYQDNTKPDATLIEGHVHVALPTLVQHTKEVRYPGTVRLNPNQQNAVFLDMQIGSNISFNPTPVFWPAPILAYAGLAGTSVAGEDLGKGRKTDLAGAMLGYTETDRQPVYCSPFASRYMHIPPAMLVVGRTGSGKTRVLLHLAQQWGQLIDPDDPTGTHHIPGWMIDPKPNSDDFTDYITNMGGKIFRLDSPKAEGVLDPIRAIPRNMVDDIVSTSVAMLSQVTGGEHGDKAREMALTSIIGYGLRHGAEGLGQAVGMAYQAKRNRAPGSELISPMVAQLKKDLESLVKNQPMFRLIFATKPNGAKLSSYEGLSLLSAGNLNIIPSGVTDAIGTMIQRWIVRMAALGASSTVIGKNGFMIQDEAWSLLGDPFGVDMMIRIGRLAREQHFQPVLASQKVDEFTNAGLQDFTGRGIILAMGSRNEMAGRESQLEAACRLFDQSTDGRMAYRMAEEKYSDPESMNPNWNSLYALFDQDKKLLRGSVGYYIGADKSAIPVEIMIDPSLT